MTEYLNSKGQQIELLSSEEFFATPEHMKAANNAPRFNNFHLLFVTEDKELYNSKLSNKKLRSILERFKKQNPESYAIINHYVENYRNKSAWWKDIDTHLYYAYVFFRLHGAIDKELFA